MIKIVSAENIHVDDLVLLNTIVQKLHAEKYPKIFKYPLDVQSVKEDFLSKILRDDHFIYIALADGKAVGYIWSQYIKRPESVLAYAASKMYIHHISVAESHRRNRVGEKLLRHTEEIAIDLDVDQIALDYWSFNEKAGSFFNEMDYKPFNLSMWKLRDS